MKFLLVEDNVAEAELTREAIHEVHADAEIHVVENGVEAVRFLSRVKPYHEAEMPDLVLLDLNLPLKSGREVLLEVKSNPATALLPIIVLTNSDAPEDVEAVYRAGGNCYLVKPHSFNGMVGMAQDLVDFWSGRVLLPTRIL